VPISPRERMQNGCLRRACRRLPRQSWSPYLSKAPPRRVSVHHHHRHRHAPRPQAAQPTKKCKNFTGAPRAPPPLNPCPLCGEPLDDNRRVVALRPCCCRFCEGAIAPHRRLHIAQQALPPHPASAITITCAVSSRARVLSPFAS
jgi:hypothetical protein